MKSFICIVFCAVISPVYSQGLMVDSIYTAGDSIVIYLKDTSEFYFATVNHTYGFSRLHGEKAEDKTAFRFPREISRKSGKLNLEISSQHELVWQGQIEIVPEDKVKVIEAYCGPKHMVVGRNDFTMLTASIIDQYDNPFPSGTEMNVLAMINTRQRKIDIETKGLSAFKRVYAPDKTGYGAVSASYSGVSSKEFRLNYYANDPNNYTLAYKRQHNYADGSQLVDIYTSEILDPFDNTVEDGTIVYLQVHDTHDKRTFATSQTIDGVAHFEIVAPVYETSWDVFSVIPNYAMSSELRLSFRQAVTDLPILPEQKYLEVGTVHSFMGQIVKDGLLVSITLEDEDNKFEYVLPTINGKAFLDYKNQLIPDGTYCATVELGILQESLDVEVQLYE